MRIERIRVEGFGALHGLDLAWPEGSVLLAVDPNETGKTTLCEAIVTALYGLPRTRGVAGRVRELRRPRNGAPMRVGLDVSAGGRKWSVDRDLDAGTLRVVDRDRGDDATAEFLRPGGRDVFGETVTGGLGEPLFRATAYVKQNVLDTDRLEAGLTVELARIADSGGGEASVVRALGALEQARREMPGATTGGAVSVDTEITRLGKRIEALKARRDALAQKRRDAAQASAGARGAHARPGRGAAPVRSRGSRGRRRGAPGPAGAAGRRAGRRGAAPRDRERGAGARAGGGALLGRRPARRGPPAGRARDAAAGARARARRTRGEPARGRARCGGSRASLRRRVAARGRSAQRGSRRSSGRSRASGGRARRPGALSRRSGNPSAGTGSPRSSYAWTRSAPPTASSSSAPRRSGRRSSSRASSWTGRSPTRPLSPRSSRASVRRGCGSRRGSSSRPRRSFRSSGGSRGRRRGFRST